MPVFLTRARLERWALVAEIVGAFAVVLSVVYLGLQIADNTKLLRSQAHYNALSLAQRPLELMVENESLAAVISKCDATPAAASSIEWERCLNYYFIQFNSWEYMYYQHRDRSIPRQLWVGADAYFKSLVATKPGYGRFWSEFNGSFDQPFRSYANRQFRR